MTELFQKLFAFIMSFIQTIKNFVGNIRSMNDKG